MTIRKDNPCLDVEVSCIYYNIFSLIFELETLVIQLYKSNVFYCVYIKVHLSRVSPVSAMIYPVLRLGDG